MPINKEWRCDSCSLDYEGYTDPCPSCGGEGKRVFRTAFQLSTGYAKRTDMVLEHQFKKKGITNYSNADGMAKVSFQEKRFGSRSTPVHGIQQPEIAANNSIQSLSSAGFDPRALQKTVEHGGKIATIPFQVPKLETIKDIPMGVKIGGPPERLFKDTTMIGGLDLRGRQVVRTS
jgi:hypothetical protein